MNERIRELAEQAAVLADFGKDIKEGRWGIGGNYQSMERFAQLIVQECISAVYDDGQDAEYYQNRIKTHFGVEQ